LRLDRQLQFSLSECFSKEFLVTARYQRALLSRVPLEVNERHLIPSDHVVRIEDLAPHASQTRKERRSFFSTLVSGRLHTGHMTNRLEYTPMSRLTVSRENRPGSNPSRPRKIPPLPSPSQDTSRHVAGRGLIDPLSQRNCGLLFSPRSLRPML